MDAEAQASTVSTSSSETVELLVQCVKTHMRCHVCQGSYAVQAVQGEEVTARCESCEHVQVFH